MELSVEGRHFQTEYLQKSMNSNSSMNSAFMMMTDDHFIIGGDIYFLTAYIGPAKSVLDKYTKEGGGGESEHSNYYIGLLSPIYSQ